MDGRTDEECFRAYVEDGDRAAFTELFRRYAPILRALMARDVRQRPVVEELVQDAFMHLHRSAADFRQGSKLRPWLMTIALNLRRERRRRQIRRPETQLELDGRRDPAVWQPPVLEQRDAARRLNAALAALPEGQREVIELHWFGGLSFREVGAAVGASTTAVKVRAHRGYQKMKSFLGRRE